MIKIALKNQKFKPRIAGFIQGIAQDPLNNITIPKAASMGNSPNLSVKVLAPVGLSIFSSYANKVGAVIALDIMVKVEAQFDTFSYAPPRQHTMQTYDFYTQALIDAFVRTTSHSLIQLGKLTIESAVPAGKGLKTSSALGAALITALYSGLKIPVEIDEIITVASDAAERAMVTQAGSLDDISASVVGGAVLTDNKPSRVIYRWELPSDLEITILIPDCARPPVHFLNRCVLMQPHRKTFDQFVSRLRTCGEPVSEMFAVMSDAAFITARTFGYSCEPLDAALKAGARGVSLSGKGPAIGAVTDKGGGERIVEAWSRFSGKILRTRPNNIGVRTEAVTFNTAFFI